VKTFIDFITDAAKDASLGKAAFQAIQSGDVATVVEFFKSRGYQVSEDDAKKLIDNRDQFNSAIQGEAVAAGY
jgi:hypothetical protein